MKIAIASGKGGTGKTTVAVNLAHSLSMDGKPVRLLDCDVEEPNCHLFVKPEFTEEKPVMALRPVVDIVKCKGCGECAKACNYNAIAVVKEKVLIFNELCHACGLCREICQQEAIREEPYSIGIIQAAPDNKPFFFAHGVLNIGEALAPAVVKGVKKYLREPDINIIDASPGTACPVVQAVYNADVAVLVTEPTPFGLNDLKLAIGMCIKMHIPTGVIINRSDGRDLIIADYLKKIEIPILGRIPFSREYAEFYSRGQVLALSFPSMRANLLKIYNEILNIKGKIINKDFHEDTFQVSEKRDLKIKRGKALDYKEITIISGKGGTGKTTVAASFAVMAKDRIIADNDVDAADLHLILKPEILEKHDFIGGGSAYVNPEECAACGVCAEACRFDAFCLDGPENDLIEKTYRIDQMLCEGCGLCVYMCPDQTIEMK
ncbi:MAG: P-loop NTPase, partial [bacterium]